MIESPSGKILQGCPSVGQGVYAGISGEVIDATLVSEVSVDAVLEEASGLSDAEEGASDAPSEVIAVEELSINSPELVASVEGIGVVVTGAEVDDVGRVEVGRVDVGCELEDGATGVPDVEGVADVVPVDGAGFVFGSVDCSQLTTPDASATTDRSLDPADQRRLREAFTVTFS